MTNKPHNSDLSTTWPRPTHSDDQRRHEQHVDDEAKREARERFLEAQQKRRAKWRQRRGWDTP